MGHIENIDIEFSQENLSKYGIFPLLIWFMLDFLRLKEKFRILSVKRKRNNLAPRRKYTPIFSGVDMAIGIVCVVLLGIKRFEKIDAKLHTETKLAQLIGLKRFFDKTYARAFIQEFQLPHLRQLDIVNTALLKEFGDSPRQRVGIVDIDQSTHSVESRKREKAVVGFNRKSPGKPCYQWSVAFVCGELVSQILDRGNTSCVKHFRELAECVRERLSFQNMIVRMDGAYMSSDNIGYLVGRGSQFISHVNYDDFMSNNRELTFPDSWDTVIYKDGSNSELSEEEARQTSRKKTIYLRSLGERKVYSKCPHKLQSVLVHIEQFPLKIRGRRKTETYVIVHNVVGLSTSRAVFEFYHQRQTIEHFFRESKNPFNSSKMPSQRFRANEAYLFFVGIAYNVFTLFKKTVCQMYGEEPLLKLLRTWP
jgi:hypothetical protein